ncbi:hypothetical protein HYH03_009332 [Edaphochlamys debaryana]|uniref:Tetratricopeptide SHNi-TPR domain-containing protein n=1 Tax=Edaphochlamys debaryana TaxID=47281 RepID=A0A836BYM1_9CHLO|nr:hypothetical protein HYH03_009332 [Edaphochlamys debaryana]|eukprot:KAG2492384.1 hypothetical protein HYH03_009332 [Edaphochlamys debaryana]
MSAEVPAAKPVAAEAPAEVTAEELERATQNIKEGKALIDDDPHKATELLCAAVRTYEKRYGGAALECADVYLYYGIAVFEVARNSTDALGATKTTVEKPDEGKAASADGAGPSGSGSGSAAPSAAEGKAEGAAEADKAEPSKAEADGDKPGPSTGGDAEGADGGEGEGEGGEADGEGEGGDGEGEEGGDAEADGSPSDDMQLAWEMLELARVIYTKPEHQPEQHHSKLAEVHKALGDIKSEQERFDEAADCFRQSIEHLRALQPPSMRRLAEVQYTLSLVLTFLDQHEAALTATQEAMQSLEAAVAETEAKLSALPTDGSGGEAAEEEGRKLQKTADDLRDVMTELQLNCEGLKETIAQNHSLKQALKAAFLKATGAAPGASGAAAEVGATTSSNAFAAPSNPATAAAAVSLGVVGRGTKRITLQPAAAGAPAQQPAAQPGAGAAAAGKRSLADLMGGAEAAVGFGAGKENTPAQGAEEAGKKARVEAAATAEPAAEGGAPATEGK